MARGPIPDKPADRPKVPEVVEMAKAHYAKPGNFTGGALHCVLDDGNLDDTCIQAAVERAKGNDDADARALAEALLAMTGTQRRRVYRSL